MSRYTFLILGLFVLLGLEAQQSYVYRQYVFNQMPFNPAYTGTREALVTALQYRNQWVGIDGSPETYSLSADMPFNEKKMAAGVVLTRESIGLYSKNTIDINYAYHLRLSKGKLSFGIKGGFQSSQIRSPYVNDNGDPNVPIIAEQFGMPNVGFGIYYYLYNQYFAGFSVPNMMHQVYSNGSPKMEVSARNYDYLFSLGGIINFGYNEQFKLRLSSLSEVNGVTGIASDLNSMIIYKNTFWLGGSVHTSGTVVYMGQIQATPQLKIGYSYDQGLGNIKSLNGSHEVTLKYEFRYVVKATPPILF